MTHRSPEPWSIRRSLAFLAATVAIMFGALLPSAVAASAAGGTPIVLCSGDRVAFALDADGDPRPIKGDGSASLDCAMALLSGLTAPPPPPIAAAVGPVGVPVAAPAMGVQRGRIPPTRGSPRPHSTAPPLA